MPRRPLRTDGMPYGLRQAHRDVVSMIGLPVLLGALGVVVLLALSTSARAGEPGDMAVSLIQLIANPTSFDGKRVAVTGYVLLEAENTAVYLHESDATYG